MSSFRLLSLLVIPHYLSQDSDLKGFQLSFLIFFYSPSLRVI